MGPGHSFLPENEATNELARPRALFAPSATPCGLSLISRIHSYLFSNWRRTVSSKLFDTQVPSISTEELVLPRHACCVLSRLRCNGHSLLLSSYLSRIGRIVSPSRSACGHPSQDTSHLILHCPATGSLLRLLFGDFLSQRSLVQALRSCPVSGAPWSSAMPPFLNVFHLGNQFFDLKFYKLWLIFTNNSRIVSKRGNSMKFLRLVKTQAQFQLITPNLTSTSFYPAETLISARGFLVSVESNYIKHFPRFSFFHNFYVIAHTAKHFLNSAKPLKNSANFLILQENAIINYYVENCNKWTKWRLRHVKNNNAGERDKPMRTKSSQSNLLKLFVTFR